MDYNFDGKEWEGVSSEAKDLVTKMLLADPDKRITCRDILNHPWLSKDTSGTQGYLLSNTSSYTVII